MAKVAITESYLEDIADAIREKTGLSTATFKPSEMANAISSISGGGITPTGTINITTNGTHDVTTYASAYVSVSGGGGSPTIDSLSVTPTTSEQTFNSSSVDGYKPVVVAAMPSGTVTAPATISGSSATVSTGINTLTLSKTVSVTPSVSTAGYVSSGTAGNSSVSLTASVTTKGATTYTPTTSDQTISSGTYLTGTQTISGDANLVAGNIKKDVTIFGTTGTYEGSGGGGDSKFVTGTFTTPTSTSTNGTVSISYSGNGYPIMLVIVVEGGIYNSNISPWYSTVTRYAVGQVTICKSITSSTPSYGDSGSENYGSIELIYKSSTSTATSYTSTRSVTANSYSDSNANGTSTTSVRWTGNKTISYRTGGGGASSYGLLAGTTYRYYVYYSA